MTIKEERQKAERFKEAIIRRTKLFNFSLGDDKGEIESIWEDIYDGN